MCLISVSEHRPAPEGFGYQVVTRRRLPARPTLYSGLILNKERAPIGVWERADDFSNYFGQDRARDYRPGFHILAGAWTPVLGAWTPVLPNLYVVRVQYRGAHSQGPSNPCTFREYRLQRDSFWTIVADECRILGEVDPRIEEGKCY